MNHKDIFSNIYKNCEWGNDKNEIYDGSSGFGSSLEMTEKLYIPFLQHFIDSNKINSICDLGCGSSAYLKKFLNSLSNISYIGYDIYGDVINFNNLYFKNNANFDFITLDILKQKNEIKKADLFLIKDVFHHWSNNDIIQFMDYFIKNINYRYILITNSCDTLAVGSKDIATGKFRPISVKNFPLSQFNAKIVLEWGNPELFSDIEIDNKKIWIKYIFETSLIEKI